MAGLNIVFYSCADFIEVVNDTVVFTEEYFVGIPGEQSPQLFRDGKSGLDLLLYGETLKSNFSKKKPKYSSKDKHNQWKCTFMNNVFFDK